jgi:hypothetical protein
MEADRISGCIIPMDCKVGTVCMRVMRLKALATSLPEKNPWFLLSWRLVGQWNWTGCFGEGLALLLLPRFEPQIFQHIS